MKLKRGYIAYFKYSRYHKDPYPLALVLFADDKVVHCLNIHYLSKDLTDELIELIAKIALKRLDARDAYHFYHNHLKVKLPHVIQNCYRVYKADHIHSAVIVSYGFETSRRFIETLKSIATPADEKKVQLNIKKEVKAVEKAKDPEDFMSMVPNFQIVDDVESYFSKIKSIVKPKIDIKKYTR
jgi:hypothetical protein